MKIKDSLKLSKILFCRHWKRSILSFVSLIIIVYIVMLLMATMQTGLDSGKSALNEYYNKNYAEYKINNKNNNSTKITKELYNKLASALDKDVECEYELNLLVKNAVISDLGLIKILAKKSLDSSKNDIYISNDYYNIIKNLGITDDMLQQDEFWNIKVLHNNRWGNSLQFNYKGVGTIENNALVMVSLDFAYENKLVDTTNLVFNVDLKNKKYNDKVKTINSFDKKIAGILKDSSFKCTSIFSRNYDNLWLIHNSYLIAFAFISFIIILFLCLLNSNISMINMNESKKLISTIAVVGMPPLTLLGIIMLEVIVLNVIGVVLAALMVIASVGLIEGLAQNIFGSAVDIFTMTDKVASFSFPYISYFAVFGILSATTSIIIGKKLKSFVDKKMLSTLKEQDIEK